MEKNTTRYCFVIRHGERADQASDAALKQQYEGHCDPILTPVGHQQARETGEFLKAQIAQIELAEGRKFDEIKFTVSPFARTITTAVEIGKVIGVTNMNLDYGWVEALYPSFYEEDPLPKLDARKIGNTGLQQEHGLQFNSCEEQYRTVGLGLFPESKESRIARVARNFACIQDDVVHNQKKESMVLEVVVTHFCLVRDIVMSIDAEQFNGARGGNCALTSFKMQVGEKVETSLMHNCFAEHVKTVA